jgi:hypothetical protein
LLLLLSHLLLLLLLLRLLLLLSHRWRQHPQAAMDTMLRQDGNHT